MVEVSDARAYLRVFESPDGRVHEAQRRLCESKAKRIVVRAGRRSGKTTTAARISVVDFMQGGRVCYAVPTTEQIDKYWYEVKHSLRDAIGGGVVKVNETEHTIEEVGTERRIKGKTAWNVDTLRGSWATKLILDEYQLMHEDAWGRAGAPMLIDKDGDAVFIYTPPSLSSGGVSKARDPRHASKLYQHALNDTSGDWEAIHFTSYDNPFISEVAIERLVGDMSQSAFRQEIMAEDDEIEMSWLVYSSFNEGVCKIKRFEIPKSWVVVSGHDFGSANPAAIFAVRVQLPIPADAPGWLRRGDYIFFKEYAPGGGSTAEHVTKFREILGDRKREVSVGGNVTTEEEIRGHYGMMGWPIVAPLVTKVSAQIDRVIGLMEQNKIYIFEDLFGLMSQINSCMWELDEEQRTKNKIKNEAKWHYLSCLRTLCTYFPVDRGYVEAVGGKVCKIW